MSLYQPCSQQSHSRQRWLNSAPPFDSLASLPPHKYPRCPPSVADPHRRTGTRTVSWLWHLPFAALGQDGPVQRSYQARFCRLWWFDCISLCPCGFGWFAAIAVLNPADSISHLFAQNLHIHRSSTTCTGTCRPPRFQIQWFLEICFIWCRWW